MFLHIMSRPRLPYTFSGDGMFTGSTSVPDRARLTLWWLAGKQCCCYECARIERERGRERVCLQGSDPDLITSCRPCLSHKPPCLCLPSRSWCDLKGAVEEASYWTMLWRESIFLPPPQHPPHHHQPFFGILFLGYVRSAHKSTSPQYCRRAGEVHVTPPPPPPVHHLPKTLVVQLLSSGPYVSEVLVGCSVPFFFFF